MKKLLFPFYPLLLGTIWTIITYSANSQILPSFSVVVKPALVVTGIIVCVWLATQLLVKDWRKSALITTIIFLLSIAHGYVREYTNIEGIRLVPIWIALAVAGIFAVFKATRPKGRETLTIIGNVVITSTLVVSISTSMMMPNVRATFEADTVPVNRSYSSIMPDVYYIIPDTYTSNYILSNYLNYDNNEFTSFLEDKGFYVVDNYFANYHHSILSISSVLNMRYWDDETLGNPASKRLGWALYNNVVANTFKAANYTYAHLGTWWSFTADNAKADITYRFSTLDELDFELYRLTLWYDLLDFLFDRGGNHILRESNLNQFSNLEAISQIGVPTFAFCHFTLPHPPFLFDESGNHVYGWLLSPEEWQRMYLNQLTFTNYLLEEAITTILDNSETPPIIIIAADEGYSDTAWQEYQDRNKGIQSLAIDSPDLVTKRQGTFFAIYKPPLWPNEQPSSPVNIFRYIFNYLFNSGLEYLPDEYYLKSLGTYEHEFIDVTEFINGQRD